MDDGSWEKWFSDLEMDECHLFDEHNMNSLEEELKGEINPMQPEQSLESLSCDSIFTAADNSNNMGNSSSLEENTQQHASSKIPNFSPHILSFKDCTTLSNVPNKTCQRERQHLKEIQQETHTRMSKKNRNTSQTQHHIIAERKRRQNLTRMFIALSAIIPGLKKLDKLSIINNTIEYVKYLQNRVKDLDQENKKGEIKYVTYFKNNKPNVDDISGISNGLDDSKIIPNVEARVSEKDVLIRVICNKENHIVTMLLNKFASHNLSIVCSNVLPFGNSALNISIIAKVDREFSMAMDELVKKLKEDLLKCCNSQQ